MKTPTLFYSEKRILSQAANLKTAASRYGVQVIFPVKSFAHSHFLKLISGFVDGFAVNSAQEEKLLRGLRKTVTYYRPGANTLPSSNKKYAAMTLDAGTSGLKDPRVFLRLNVSGIARSQSSRFGVDLTTFAKSHANKLHLHVNDPDMTVQELIRFHQKLFHELKKRKIALQALNIGGGFQTLSAKEVQRFFSVLRKLWGQKIELIAEPGRYFTYGAGYAQAEIISVTDSPRQISTSFSFELHGRGSFHIGLFVPPSKGKTSSLLVAGPTAFEEDARTFSVSPTVKFHPGETLIFTGLSGYSVSWNHSLQGVPKAKIQFRN